MIVRLVEAGQHVRAGTRTDDRRRDLERLGAHAVRDVAAAGAEAEAACQTRPGRSDMAAFWSFRLITKPLPLALQSGNPL
jgi:hypothetical protein